MTMSEPLTTTQESVSPVTLSADWSRVARLLLLASMSAIGSIANVFMISAVMIEDYLRKRGNAFIVNVALADLLITGLVIPASAVVILAGLPDNNLTVCHFQWFLDALCFFVTVLSSAAIAVENYVRLCCSPTTYSFLTKSKVTAIVLTIWATCAVTSGLQFATDLSFDYCNRQHTGLIPYQAAVGVVFVLLPVSLTFFCYFGLVRRVKVAKTRANYKQPATFTWDHALMRTNLYSFIMFVVFWLPFGVVLAVGSVKKIPNSIFYYLSWLAISKSCVNSILYCIANRHFRGAYVNLFHYCCCKTTVSFSRRQRPEAIRPSGDVRVHIIPGYNMYCSPQRGREGQRFAAGRTNGRDVYEL